MGLVREEQDSGNRESLFDRFIKHTTYSMDTWHLFEHNSTAHWNTYSTCWECEVLAGNGNVWSTIWVQCSTSPNTVLTEYSTHLYSTKVV